MADTDLQISIGVDASGVTQGAAQARAALASITPEVQSLSRAFVQLGQSAKGGLAGQVDPMVATFTGGLVKMAEGTKTFGQVLASVGRTMLNDFVSKVINPMIEQWITKEITQTAQTVAGLGTRSAAQATAAISDIAAGKAAAAAQVATQVGLAGAGGVASMAAAPFPLDLTAPAFGAAMAAAAAAQGAAAAAAGGFDVGDFAPITQLHPREMVLPAHLADRVRNMTAGEASGSSSITFNHTAHVYGRDAETAANLSQRQMRRWAENAARNNVFRGLRRG
ncbi:MAG TPA: hypothetical protein VMU37_07840 [Caulobacteraceae bacterium]|nr:hypothetical protein [Caulobacteraceae bacterium]